MVSSQTRKHLFPPFQCRQVYVRIHDVLIKAKEQI